MLSKPASGPKRSRYALAEIPGGVPGEYGAVALKDFPATIGGQLCHIVRGNVIPPEVIASWPVNNRRAMETTRFVRYFLTPAEAELAKGSA